MPGTRYCARERPIISSARPFSSIRVSDISFPPSPPYSDHLPGFPTFVRLVRPSIFFLFLFSHRLHLSASYFALLRIILDRRRRRRDTPERTGSIFGSRARDVAAECTCTCISTRNKRSVPILSHVSIHI